MSVSDNSITERVRALVQPIVDDLGLELYDLEYAGGMVKVTIDTPPGSPGGVDVDQLSRATRLISRDLDHADPIPGQYTLEVSSPGLERNLRLPRHFEREVGKQVAVRLRNPIDGERRVNGVLVSSDETTFTVRTESGHERTIVIDQVDRARTVFVWEASPKPVRGAKGARGKKSGSGPSSADDSAASTADLWADSDEPFEEDLDHDDQEHSES
jgi:ribosome maturation factor RimP